MKMTKEFRAGMEHAIRTIAAQNPEARSANAEIRGECQREIWKEIDRMVVEDAKAAAPAGMKFTGIQKMGGSDVASYKEI